MFKTTKIKLTARYLVIIMTISLSFSAVMYQGVNAITKRALDNQRVRLERRLNDYEGMRPGPRFNSMFIDEDALVEVRDRTLNILIVTNLVILVVAGYLGYFLAGKTLRPIEDMLYKQKRFISDAAHELKTPLTAMKTDLEVTLRDKDLNLTDGKRSINNTIEEIDKLDVFINNLLKKSKHELQLKHDEFTVFNFNSVIENSLKTLLPIAHNKGIKIHRDLPDSHVKALESDLQELSMNLIDNAIKYSGQDTNVFISLSTQGKNVILSVKDEGEGIEQHEINHIFQAFYKVDKSRTKKETHGYGLGLAIVKDIVSSYKGSVDVHSKINNGTTFKVTLPISQEPLSS